MFLCNRERKIADRVNGLYHWFLTVKLKGSAVMTGAGGILLGTAGVNVTAMVGASVCGGTLSKDVSENLN